MASHWPGAHTDWYRQKKAQRGEKRYSSTLSLTSALDAGGWSTPRPGRFTPGKETR